MSIFFLTILFLLNAYCGVKKISPMWPANLVAAVLCGAMLAELVFHG